MKASEAKKLVKQKEENLKLQVKVEQEKRKIKEQEYIKLGEIAAKVELNKIKKSIKQAATDGETETEYCVTYSSEYYGQSYLSSMAKSIKHCLEKLGYSCIFEVRDSYATIYDGSLMNPEAIGSEYCNHRLEINIRWDA